VKRINIQKEVVIASSPLLAGDKAIYFPQE